MADYTMTMLGTATELIDLPFDRPLVEWDDPRLVQVPRGISRHVVRFVQAHGQIFAIKEATDRFVLTEHRLLRELDERSVPAVDAFGTVTGRRGQDGEELGGLLITRYLPFSMPYRALFTRQVVPDLQARLLDSLALLFVRLHLAGFYWGDCSLSNTLFRRDAGALAAYLVDAETGELHNQLSDGQRRWDVDIATENITGELFDLQASGRTPEDLDPVVVAEQLAPQYENLWWELTSDAVVGRDESYLIDHRIKRLNQLGFDVEQMEINTLGGGSQLRFHAQVVESGHHRRRLYRLTGLDVQENQARALLSDMARFQARWQDGVGYELPEDLVARRWLDEKFYYTLALVPPDLRAKLPDAELYHQITEHRWFLSEVRGHDVGREEAVKSYVRTVLDFMPDAKIEVLEGDTEEMEAIHD
jgi:Domain of unknown function (DUF4032)/Lipopolysaccharide kinase (Kdo/WaaP) family